MRCIPVYISLLFIRLIDNVRPYFIGANTFIRNISGILSRSKYKEMNDTIVIGFMDHDPKEAAMKIHECL
jgi:hypothetical protein